MGRRSAGHDLQPSNIGNQVWADGETDLDVLAERVSEGYESTVKSLLYGDESAA